MKRRRKHIYMIVFVFTIYLFMLMACSPSTLTPTPVPTPDSPSTLTPTLEPIPDIPAPQISPLPNKQSPPTPPPKQPVPEKTEEPSPIKPVEESQERGLLDCDSRSIFTTSPLDIDNILGIVPLGNLNPPSHTFPTDHIYFYLPRREGGDCSDVVTLYSPGDLIITRVNASEHVTAGFTDYSITLQPCTEITVVLGHVSTLSEDLFGDTSAFSNWRQNNEYSTGGETYRHWGKEYNIEISAGQILGTVGGNPNQWALDLGVYDQRITQENVANPRRWQQSWYLRAADPLYYYKEGELLNQLLKLVDRDIVEGKKPPYGSVLQDIPGTAQGCWFLSGVDETYPEDPHLALVHSNSRPSYAALSVGNSVRNLSGDEYGFLPKDIGRLNRDFQDITSDGQLYGFQVNGFAGIIIIQMPDAETLWLEALAGATTYPTSWSFTGNKTVFVR
jgi:hypothetical protein